jgi:acetyl esterase/lipase
MKLLHILSLITAISLGAANQSLQAQTVMEPINVWPSTPPGRTAAKGPERDTSDAKSRGVAGKPVIRTGDVSSPTLTIYQPAADKNSGAAVMVCPGGGYSILAYDLEGTEVCEWLNSVGVTAALLKYRVPKPDGDSRPVEPLQDAERAMSILRSRATELSIDPNRIGVLGFSAGGHLSARLSTNYAKRAYEKMDEADEASCRPDFAMLIYPAYLFDKDSKEWISEELPVDADTPPMFLTMAFDDPIDPSNVLRLSLAMKQAKVPVELHLYPSGGHGYGLRKTENTSTSWPDRAAEWLRSQGWVK